MKKRNAFVIFIIFFLTGGAVFVVGNTFFGKQLQQTPLAGLTSHKPTQLRHNMRPFYGQIVTKKDTTLTIKNLDGSMAKVMITETTKIVSGEKSDLIVNKKISGVGELTNGVILAKNIQINPQSGLTK